MDVRCARRWCAFGLVAAAVLTACTSGARDDRGGSGNGPPSPAGGPEQVRARKAADDALAALRATPVTAYTLTAPASVAGSVNDRVRDRLAVVTSKDGLVYARGRIDGRPVRLLGLEDKVFVTAPESYWRERGRDRPTTRRYAHRPELFHAAQLGMSPATQTPEGMAGVISMAIASVTDPPALVEPAGVPAFYRFEVPGGGVVDVSSREPHRIVHTDVTPAAESLPFGLDNPTADFTNVKEALDNVSDIADLGKLVSGALMTQKRDFRVSLPPEAGLLCATASGACSAVAAVTNEIHSEFWEATEVIAMLHFFVDGGQLGTRTCWVTVTMPANGRGRASCDVSFTLPPPSDKPRTFPLRGWVKLAGKWATWQPNLEKINDLYASTTLDYLKSYCEQYYKSVCPKPWDHWTVPNT